MPTTDAGMFNAITVTHSNRLADIADIERSERQHALDLYRRELRAMWRAAPGVDRFDRHVRRVTRGPIRDAYTAAIQSSLERADRRHVAADRVRRTMLAAFSDVRPNAMTHEGLCPAAHGAVWSAWLVCECGAARRALTQSQGA